MNRRNWLSSAGATAAGSLAGFSALADSRADKRSWVLSFESFRVSNAEQMKRLHSYLGGTFLPYLARVHRGPKIVLEAIIAPHTPQVMVVTAFPSFDELIEIQNQVAAYPGIQRARADLSRTAHNGTPQQRFFGLNEDAASCALESGESQILVTTADSLQLHDRLDSLGDGIIELRSYLAAGWRDRPPVAASAAFRRAGIDPILTATAAGEHLPRFTYLVPFADLAVRQDAWARLDRDSEWSGLEAKVTGASIYKLAPYSRLS